jgi:metallo-beta-lactamase family protein
MMILSQYLSCQNANLVKNIFIVHGELEVMYEFQRRLSKKGFKSVQIPKMHQLFNLD